MLPYLSFANRKASVWFSPVVGLDFMCTELRFKDAERNNHCFVLLSFLFFTRFRTICTSQTYTLPTYASTRAAATPRRPPPHLPATGLRGIKQTVIDLRYDCLFCLAVSDG